MNSQLEVKNLTHIYKTGEGIRDINLHVKKGELLTLLGPSGCGKTTILRSVGGFVTPQAGQIIVNNQDISRLAPEKRPTAMVFQSYNLWPHMNIYDNLSFSMKLKKLKKQTMREKVNAVLRLIRLEGMEKKYPAELSGGQQQRVALARALLLNPKVLLLDEPFSALDAKLRHELREELREIQSKEKLTMLFVTHDQEEALSISDRIVVMNKGNIEQAASPKDIYNDPKTLFVATFIGKMNFIHLEAKNGMTKIGNASYRIEDMKETKLTAAIRPEDISFQSSNHDLTGTVRKVMILGHYAEVTVETAYGMLKTFIEKKKLEKLAINAEVSLIIQHVTFYEKGLRKKSAKQERLQPCLNA